MTAIFVTTLSPEAAPSALSPLDNNTDFRGNQRRVAMNSDGTISHHGRFSAPSTCCAVCCELVSLAGIKSILTVCYDEVGLSYFINVNEASLEAFGVRKGLLQPLHHSQGQYKCARLAFMQSCIQYVTCIGLY